METIRLKENARLELDDGQEENGVYEYKCQLYLSYQLIEDFCSLGRNEEEARNKAIESARRKIG